MNYQQTSIQTGHINADGNVNIGNQMITNIFHSADWKKFQEEKQEIEKNIQTYPDIPVFKEQLEKVKQKINDFKNGVIKLAEEFQKIEINTERLKIAYEHFQNGDFSKARTILDAEQMLVEQNQLLQQKEKLQIQLVEVRKQLENNANEWLLKAQLTSIDYNLKEQRISLSCEYFENALKSQRSPEILFQYAIFLHDNNQSFNKAINICQEILNLFKQLNQESLFISIVQNYLATIFYDLGHYKQAEAYCCQALSIRKKILEQNNDKKYLIVLTESMHNLALIFCHLKKLKEAEKLYNDILEIHLLYSLDDDLALLQAYNNLIILKNDKNDYKKAKEYSDKALAIGEYLLQQEPNNESYSMIVSTLKINIANLLAKQKNYKEAEKYALIAKEYYQKLVENNPEKYLPNFINILYNFSTIYLEQKNYSLALPLLQEANDLLEPLLKQDPNIHTASSNKLKTLLENPSLYHANQ